MKKNNNITKTLLLIMFVLLGQTSLKAEGGTKIWYEKSNHIHIVKENGKIKVSLVDSKDNSKDNSKDINEIYVKPDSNIKFHFEVKSGKDDGYKLEFPLNRREDIWSKTKNGVTKNQENSDTTIYIYNLLQSTQNLDENVIKSTTVSIEEGVNDGKLILKNVDGTDTVLTVNVLKPVVFEGLKWCLTKDEGKYIYDKDGKETLDSKEKLLFSIDKSNFLKDHIIKLATFSIINNTSESVNWNMDPNLFTKKTGLSLYSVNDTLLINNFNDNFEDQVKEYFIGVKESNLKQINNYNANIPIKLKVDDEEFSRTIPELQINITNAESKGDFNWKWLYWLIPVVLIILLRVLVFKPKKRGSSETVEGEGEKPKKCWFFKPKKDNGRRKDPLPEPIQIVGGGKPTQIEPGNEKKKQHEELLKIILQTILVKFEDNNSKDIDSFIEKTVADTKLLPESLSGKTTLLNNYIYKDEKKVEELNNFLEEYERKREDYRKENQELKIDKLSDVSTSLGELNTLYKELGLSRGSVQEDVSLIRNIKEQFGGLKKHDSFVKLEFDENNFADKIIDEIEILKNEIKTKNREFEDKKKEYKTQLNQLVQEKKSELDAERKDKEQAILQLKEEHKFATKNLNSKLESYTNELEARNLDYISNLLFCVEEISRVYTDILKASKTSKMVDEMIRPVLVGDNNIGGLRAFMNKLKKKDVLLKSLKLGKESWADLKVEETKAVFVKEIILGNDFLSTVDLISILYVYSKINYNGVNVTNDLLELNIKPTEIDYAYKILSTTLKYIFDIDIKLYNLFDDLYNESIHELSTARRFSNLNSSYTRLHNKIEVRSLVDMLSVGLESNTYKEANRKAQIIYR